MHRLTTYQLIMTNKSYNHSCGYYAVIFTSTLTEDVEGYHQMAASMENLAQQQAGFLGVESAREVIGITVSYWQSLEAIQQWKQQLDHQQAQRFGRERWYQSYRVRIAKVEKDYEFVDGQSN